MKLKHTSWVGKVGGLFVLSLVLARGQEVWSEIGFYRGFAQVELYSGRKRDRAHRSGARGFVLVFLVCRWWMVGSALPTRLPVYLVLIKLMQV